MRTISVELPSLYLKYYTLYGDGGYVYAVQTLADEYYYSYSWMEKLIQRAKGGKPVNIKIREHAILRYSERVGVGMLEAHQELQELFKDILKKSVPTLLTRDEVKEYGVVPRKYNKYYAWYSKRAEQTLIAVTHKDIVITILTENYHGFKRDRKHSKSRVSRQL